MFSIRKLSLNCLKSPALQTFLRNPNYSTAKLTAAVEPTSILENSKNEVKATVSKVTPKLKEYKTSTLVATAFASLQAEEEQDKSDNKQTYNDKRISSAKNIDELLTIANNGILSRQYALKVN